MNFNICNRWTGDVIVTAEINCDEGASRSIKLGLAVKWALKAGANLAGAYLAYANLADANLAGANLAGAYLAGAYLARANLAGANLAGAYLAGAYLARANLARANLAGAYLADANLVGAVGNMTEVRSMQIEKWPVTWTTAPDGDVTLQIGCQRHALALWEKSDPRWIAAMDSRATDWWAKWREPLLSIVRANPAVPFGVAKKSQAE